VDAKQLRCFLAPLNSNVMCKKPMAAIDPKRTYQLFKLWGDKLAPKQTLSLRFLKIIQWATRVLLRFHNMGINHCCFDITVPQEHLDAT